MTCHRERNLVIDIDDAIRGVADIAKVERCGVGPTIAVTIGQDRQCSRPGAAADRQMPADTCNGR